MLNTMIHDPAVTGVLMAVLAAFCFALWNLYLQRGLDRGGSNSVSVVTLNLAATGFFLPVTLGQALTGTLPPVRLGALLWFVLVGLTAGSLGPWLSAHATRRLGATNTTALRLLDPFFAFAIALLFLGEKVSWQAMAGIVLIVVALGVLQLRRGGASSGGSGAGAGGMGFAVAASLTFTLASVARKAGLHLTPSAWLSGLAEGSVGLAVWVASALGSGGLSDVRSAFRRQHLDLWLSGLASACGALFMNLALQRVAVPVTMTLRNTAPWFALLLAPVLLGRQFRAGGWMWLSTGLLTCGMMLIVLR